MNTLAMKRATANIIYCNGWLVPGLHLGACYDKNTGVAQDYLGLTVGIKLLFWNRNRGNCKTSKQLMENSAK